MFIPARPAPLQISILTPVSPATRPCPQLAPFSLRHFGNGKPSSTREMKALVASNPMPRHYTYQKSDVLGERMIGERQSSPGMQQGQAHKERGPNPGGVKAAAHS